MQRKFESYFPAIALACLLGLFGIGASAQTPTFSRAPVSVSISPVSASLLTGGTQQFTATVTGSRNSAVTWSATSGTVSSSGLYTAPTTTGSYTVTATSVADTTKSASASGTVTAASAQSVSFVQVAAATPRSPQSAVTVVYRAAQTAGNLNVVVFGWNAPPSNVPSVSDSSGNAYTRAVGPTIGTGLSQSIYFAKDIVSGSNAVTVTFDQPAAYPDIRILEYAGLDTVSPLNVTAAAAGNGSNASSGPATTTATSELILGADTIATTTTGVESGFTSRIITSPDSNLVEDKVVSTTGTYSATASLSSGSWVMQMAAFKAAAAAGSSSPAVAVSVNPSSTNLATGATQQFTATVTGATNTTVTWSASCGTITTSGLYTAPTATESCNITATSQADTTKSASATVTVTAASVVAVSISPGSASLISGTTQQFTANVTGTSNTAVTWSTTGGTVTTNGLYTAPATAGTYTVTATSQANTSKSASATVAVTAPVVALSISPVSASLLTGGTEQFAATVTGSSNTAVNWSASGGTVSTNGLYSAPATADTYTVTATSVADTTKSATASVAVTSSSAGSATLVQHVSCPNGRSTGNAQSPTPDYICPLPEPSQGGNALILGVTVSSGSTYTVSDDKSNTWNLVNSVVDGSSGNYVAIYLALNVTQGTRFIKLHRSTAANNVALYVSEYYNVPLSSAVDTSSCFASSGSTSITAGKITPVVAGDLLWQFATNGSAGGGGAHFLCSFGGGGGDAN